MNGFSCDSFLLALMLFAGNELINLYTWFKSIKSYCKGKTLPVHDTTTTGWFYKSIYNKLHSSSHQELHKGWTSHLLQFSCHTFILFVFVRVQKVDLKWLLRYTYCSSFTAFLLYSPVSHLPVFWTFACSLDFPFCLPIAWINCLQGCQPLAISQPPLAFYYTDLFTKLSLKVNCLNLYLYVIYYFYVQFESFSVLNSDPPAHQEQTAHVVITQKIQKCDTKYEKGIYFSECPSDKENAHKMFVQQI